MDIDGSEQALSAVRAAATEASHRNEPLHIVHAFIWSSLHVDVGPVAGDLPETGLRHHAEDLLKEAAAEAEKAAPPVTTALIDGAATPVLLEESHQAALLALRDRGLGGVSGLIIGSVAMHAAAHAGCPVLVIRSTDLYDEVLRQGESAVMIHATLENKVALARLLQQHRGHAIHYFGVRSAESLSGP